MKQMTKEYRYFTSSYAKAVIAGTYIMFGLIVLSMIYMTVRFLVHAFTSDLPSSDSVFDILMIWLGLLTLWLFRQYHSLVFGTITVNEQGLLVTGLLIKQRIRWEDVQRIDRRTWMGTHVYHIRARNMGPLNTLMSLHLMGGLRPSFPIFSFLRHHQQLINEIGMHIDHSQASAP